MTPQALLRTYPNLRQLPQLQRFDPASAQAARIALRGGMVKTANDLIRRSMQAVFDRLLAASGTQSKVAHPRCDAYLGVPANLKRCRRVARFQLTVVSGGEPYEVVYCQSCRDELWSKVKVGTILEVLTEKSLNLPGRVGHGEARRGSVWSGEVGHGRGGSGEHPPTLKPIKEVR